MTPTSLPMRSALDPPDWLVALGRVIRRIGMVRTVMLATAFSTIVSAAMTAIALVLIAPSGLALGLGISSTVSLIVSATVSYVLCSVVADLERTRSLMWRLVNIDAQTQAFTRRYFLSRARRALANGQVATVALIDIDDFKRVNDSHGHAAGDAVLYAVSKVFRRRLQPSALFARYGGEEFAVLMQGTPPLPASELMEQLRCRLVSLSTPMPDGSRIRVTASIGLAALRCHGSGNADRAVQEALGAADRALYRAKGLGKNRVLIDPLSLPRLAEPAAENGTADPAADEATGPAISSVARAVIADSLDCRFIDR